MKQNSNLVWGLAAVCMVFFGWLAFGFFIWDGPTDAEVRAAFLAKHPQADVLEVNDRAVGPNRIHFEIAYKDGGDAPRQEVWTYERIPRERSRWKRTSPPGG